MGPSARQGSKVRPPSLISNLKLTLRSNIQGAKSPVDNDAALSLLDWTGITEKFNSSNNQAQKRKQEELRFSYIAAAKYSNKSAWSAKEKAKLQQLVEGYRARSEAVDWAKVSDELGVSQRPK